MRIEECPHGKLKVVSEYIWNRFMRFSTFRAEVKDFEIARECVEYAPEALLCIEVYDCGCLLRLYYDDTHKIAYIIPSDRALEYLKYEVESHNRFKFLYDRYKRKISPQSPQGD